MSLLDCSWGSSSVDDGSSLDALLRASAERPARQRPPRRSMSCSSLRSPVLQCQVEGCGAGLEGERKYCVAKRICSEHLKAEHVRRPGQPGLWRFCFQCSKLEPVDAFDGARRTCRARLVRRRMPRRASWTVGLASECGQQALLSPPSAAAAACGSGFVTPAVHPLVTRELNELAQVQQQIDQLQAQLAAVRTSSAMPAASTHALAAPSGHSLGMVAHPVAHPTAALASSAAVAWPPASLACARPGLAPSASAVAAPAGLVPPPAAGHAASQHPGGPPQDDLLGLLSGIEADIEGGEDPLAAELMQALEAELPGIEAGIQGGEDPLAAELMHTLEAELASASGTAQAVPGAAVGSLARPAVLTAPSPQAVVAAAPPPPPPQPLAWASQRLVGPAVVPRMAQLPPAAQTARLAWLEQRNAQLSGALASVQALFVSMHSAVACGGDACSTGSVAAM